MCVYMNCIVKKKNKREEDNISPNRDQHETGPLCASEIPKKKNNLNSSENDKRGNF